MTRPIVIWPDPVLDTPTQPVTEFGEKLDALLKEMDEAMRAHDGIGIAANQIGEPLRTAIVGRGDGTFFEIVNPEVLHREGKVTLEEGCLSIPGEWEKCPRFHKVRVRYQDKTGEWHELEAEGRLAHVLQHEIDHLDGRVYATHLSPLKKGLIRRAMLKVQRMQSREQAAKTAE